MNPHRRRLLRLAAALCWAGAGRAAAQEGAAGGVPAHIGRALGAARLLGQGSYRWFGLKLYEAALWIPRDASPAAVAAFAHPFVLELRYARALQGSRIAEASVGQMEYIGAGTTVDRARWGAAMRQLFPDVEDGTRLAGIHQPGNGARFLRDGQPLGEIADPRFATAFFGIWLDARSSAPDLRRALLGEQR